MGARDIGAGRQVQWFGWPAACTVPDETGQGAGNQIGGADYISPSLCGGLYELINISGHGTMI
jgi:hypothetical protein